MRVRACVKACPPCNLETCALRMQLFIGLKSLCVEGCHVILLSKADTDAPEEPERTTQRRGLYVNTKKKKTHTNPQQQQQTKHSCEQMR